jgi:hypothetical protein
MGPESMWVWGCVGVGVCGYGREREMLKSWERECVGLWVCGYGREKLKTEMLKTEILTTEDTKYTEKEKKAGDRERECVGVWVWEGERKLKTES